MYKNHKVRKNWSHIHKSAETQDVLTDNINVKSSSDAAFPLDS